MSPIRGREIQFDPEFCYKFTTFDVGGFQFCLPVSALEMSPVLKEKLSQVRDPGQEFPDIGDVTAAEFRDFLRCLIQIGGVHPQPSSWSAVMKLATMWKVETIRQMAIERMRYDKDAALRLLIGRQYDVKEFLPKALDDLVNRKRPLEVAEYQTLGIELAANVMKYRELCRGSGGLTTGDRSEIEKARWKHMETVFGIEFVRDVKEGSKLLCRLSSVPLIMERISEE